MFLRVKIPPELFERLSMTFFEYKIHVSGTIKCLPATWHCESRSSAFLPPIDSSSLPPSDAWEVASDGYADGAIAI